MLYFTFLSFNKRNNKLIKFLTKRDKKKIDYTEIVHCTTRENFAKTCKISRI